MLIINMIFFASLPLVAQPAFELPKHWLNEPFYLLFLLIFIALLPFIAIMVTSFAKIVVVLSITRQALGTAQSPPNMVIVSLSMILTLFSMYPVFSEIKLKLEPIPQLANVENLMQVWDMVKEPVREFMVKHAHPQDRELFAKMISSQSKLDENDFIILAPAFLISELSQAFHMGFLVYLPFLVIDMTVANLLMALGMQMLSPTTISLPFKILLFVLVDGWRLLAEGLVRS